MIWNKDSLDNAPKNCILVIETLKGNYKIAKYELKNYDRYDGTLRNKDEIDFPCFSGLDKPGSLYPMTCLKSLMEYAENSLKPSSKSKQKLEEWRNSCIVLKNGGDWKSCIFGGECKYLNYYRERNNPKWYVDGKILKNSNVKRWMIINKNGKEEGI